MRCHLKTRNFTNNVWAHEHFGHPENCHFLVADISLSITRKKLTIAQTTKSDKLFKLFK